MLTRAEKRHGNNNTYLCSDQNRHKKKATAAKKAQNNNKPDINVESFQDNICTPSRGPMADMRRFLLSIRWGATCGQMTSTNGVGTVLIEY